MTWALFAAALMWRTLAGVRLGGLRPVPPPEPPRDPWEDAMERSYEARTAGRIDVAAQEMRAAVAALGDPPADERRLVISLTALASYELRLGHFDAAREVAGRLEPLMAIEVIPLVSHVGSDLHEILGELALIDGRVAVAESHYRAAVRIEERIGGPRTPTLLNALSALARLLRRREALGRSARAYEQLLKLEHPDSGGATLYRRELLLEFASLRLQQGDEEAALPLIEEAEALALLPPPSPETRAGAALGRTELLMRAGHLEDAEESIRALVAEVRERTGTGGALIQPLEQLARVLTRQGRLAEAADVRTELIQLGVGVWGDDSPHLAMNLEELADLQVRNERAGTALSSLERAQRALWTSSGPLEWRLPRLLVKQAILVEEQGCTLQADDYRRVANRLGGRLNQRGSEN